MSDSVTIPPDPTEIANGAAPTPTPTPMPMPMPPPAPGVGGAEYSIASTPVLALLPTLPPETHALVELIGCGLAPEADESTRTAARELWARFAQAIATAAPPMPTAQVASPTPMPLPTPVTLPALVMPLAPAVPPLATIPTVPLPTSPIAMAARALRQLPPDQLLDLVLQRLRAALPAGTTVPTPKGIQFQLVPVSPPSSR